MLILSIDYKKKVDEISAWITRTVHGAGFKKVVIGLSGGIDSAVSAALATRALGKENVFVLMLPYGEMSKQHVNDAKIISDYLEISEENRLAIDIKNSTDVILKEAKRPIGSSQNQKDSIASLEDDSIRKGNIMARTRMIYIFDLAKKLNTLVVGTENRTEHLLGYFTRFGDSASDLEPIVSLYKTQIWELAKYLGIPQNIISKVPTAGLWQEQTDEGELGFTYRIADQILYYTFDQKLSEDDIVAKGISKDVVEKVLETVKKNEFKQKVPYTF